jgi:hypothetical protein
VDAKAALRRKVPHAGAAVESEGWITEIIRRKFVGGIDQPARRLEPGLEARRLRQKIPAEDDRRDADAAKGAAAILDGAWRRNIVDQAVAGLRVWGRSIGLPERHDVAAELELPAKDAGMNDRAERFAKLKAGHKKLIAVAVAQAIAIVDEGAILPAAVVANLGDGIINWIADNAGIVAIESYRASSRCGDT